MLHNGVICTTSYVMVMHIKALSLRYTVAAISHGGRSDVNVEISVSLLAWDF